jgi:hypothetical protein
MESGGEKVHDLQKHFESGGVSLWNWPAFQVARGKFSNNFRWRCSDKRASHPTDESNPNQPHNQYMKLFLSALCASFMIAPSSFSAECEKGKCDKEKKEETILADCGKCKKKDGDKEEEKKEGTLAGKCKKDGDCDKEKEDEGTLAGKCKKDGDCDKEKEEGTLAGKCKKDGDCDKEKEDEGTLAGKCKKDGDCDKEKEDEGTLAHCGKCKKGDKDHEEEKKEGTLA